MKILKRKTAHSQRLWLKQWPNSRGSFQTNFQIAHLRITKARTITVFAELISRGPRSSRQRISSHSQPKRPRKTLSNLWK